MLVHLAGARYKMVDHIDHYRRVVAAIHEEGHDLAKDWIEPSYNIELKYGPDHPVDWGKINKESLEAINKADVIIADATIRSFSTGYQVATAVQMKKPILVLRRKDTDDSFFASGIGPSVCYQEYTDDTIKDIIKKFLKENDIQAKDMRFNFFIDRPIYNYLRWASYKTGKTKAEILRELVAKEIDKNNEIN